MKFLKRTLTLVIVLASFSYANAQTKIGYIDYTSVVIDLPEYQKMNDSLMAYYQELQKDLVDIENSYMKKQAELQQRIEAGETNKKILELDQYGLEQLQQLYQYTQEENQNKLAQKQDELLEPLKTKVDNAIAEVSKEKGFSMVMDSSVLYFKKDSDDVEDLVRTKLKIISKKESAAKRKNGNQDLPDLHISPMGN